MQLLKTVSEDKTKTAVRNGPGVADPISEQPDGFDEVFWVLSLNFLPSIAIAAKAHLEKWQSRLAD